MVNMWTEKTIFLVDD